MDHQDCLSDEVTPSVASTSVQDLVPAEADANVTGCGFYDSAFTDLTEVIIMKPTEPNSHYSLVDEENIHDNTTSIEGNSVHSIDTEWRKKNDECDVLDTVCNVSLHPDIEMSQKFNPEIDVDLEVQDGLNSSGNVDKNAASYSSAGNVGAMTGISSTFMENRATLSSFQNNSLPQCDYSYLSKRFSIISLASECDRQNVSIDDLPQVQVFDPINEDNAFSDVNPSFETECAENHNPIVTSFAEIVDNESVKDGEIEIISPPTTCKNVPVVVTLSDDDYDGYVEGSDCDALQFCGDNCGAEVKTEIINKSHSYISLIDCDLHDYPQTPAMQITDIDCDKTEKCSQEIINSLCTNQATIGSSDNLSYTDSRSSEMLLVTPPPQNNVRQQLFVNIYNDISITPPTSFIANAESQACGILKSSVQLDQNTFSLNRQNELDLNYSNNSDLGNTISTDNIQSHFTDHSYENKINAMYPNLESHCERLLDNSSLSILAEVAIAEREKTLPNADMNQNMTYPSDYVKNRDCNQALVSNEIVSKVLHNHPHPVTPKKNSVTPTPRSPAHVKFLEFARNLEEMRSPKYSAMTCSGYEKNHEEGISETSDEAVSCHVDLSSEANSVAVAIQGSVTTSVNNDMLLSAPTDSRKSYFSSLTLIEVDKPEIYGTFITEEGKGNRQDDNCTNGSDLHIPVDSVQTSYTKHNTSAFNDSCNYEDNKIPIVSGIMDNTDLNLFNDTLEEMEHLLEASKKLKIVEKRSDCSEVVGNASAEASCDASLIAMKKQSVSSEFSSSAFNPTMDSTHASCTRFEQEFSSTSAHNRDIGSQFSHSETDVKVAVICSDNIPNNLEISRRNSPFPGECRVVAVTHALEVFDASLESADVVDSEDILDNILDTQLENCPKKIAVLPSFEEAFPSRNVQQIHKDTNNAVDVAGDACNLPSVHNKVYHQESVLNINKNIPIAVVSPNVTPKVTAKNRTVYNFGGYKSPSSADASPNRVNISTTTKPDTLITKDTKAPDQLIKNVKSKLRVPTTFKTPLRYSPQKFAASGNETDHSVPTKDFLRTPVSAKLPPASLKRCKANFLTPQSSKFAVHSIKSNVAKSAGGGKYFAASCVNASSIRRIANGPNHLVPSHTPVSLHRVIMSPVAQSLRNNPPPVLLTTVKPTRNIATSKLTKPFTGDIDAAVTQSQRAMGCQSSVLHELNSSTAEREAKLGRIQKGLEQLVSKVRLHL